MQTSLLFVHVTAATVGLLSGFAAMTFRKGSGLHSAAGTVFFVSMLIMSSTAAYIAAFLRPNELNVTAGLLTFYLVGTGRAAIRRRSGGTNQFDLVALLFVVAVGTFAMRSGLQAASSATHTLNGVPPVGYFIFGAIALLFAVADVRMLVRGGYTGTQRIVRHLWRMGLALVIATLSFYPGQARLFPKWLRATNLLSVPLVVVIGALIFWLVRMRGRKRSKAEDSTAPSSSVVLQGAR